MNRIRVQRTPTWELLGAAVMIGANDLSFLDSDVEWIKIKKTKTENGLIVEIGA